MNQDGSQKEVAMAYTVGNDLEIIKGVIRVICAWCGMFMYDKDGEGREGISHGICDSCRKKEKMEGR